MTHVDRALMAVYNLHGPAELVSEILVREALAGPRRHLAMMFLPLLTLACSGAGDRPGDTEDVAVCEDIPVDVCSETVGCTPGVAALLELDAASGRDCWTQERQNAVCVDEGTFGNCDNVETAAAPPDDPTDCLLFGNSCTPPDWIPCTTVPDLTCPLCVSDSAPTTLAPDITISGGVGMGRAIAAAGDTNGDGFQDVLVGRKRGAVLLFGPFEPGEREVNENDAVWEQEETDDRAATALAGLGDLDNDGTNDIAIGAPYYGDGGEQPEVGVVYVFKGPLRPGSYSLGDSTLRFYGEEAGDQVGTSIHFGKVTDDGLWDLVVGAPGTDNNGNDSGSIFVLAGPLAPGLQTMSKAHTEILGDSQLGKPFALADTNGDGIDDVVMGQDPASATVIYGPLDRGTIKASKGERLTPSGPSSTAVTSIAVGDLDADGDPDLVWGAEDNATNGQSSGTVWAVTDPWGGGNQTLDATTAVHGRCEIDETGQALALGDVSGDGIDDLLIGGAGTDSARFAVAVFFGPVAGGELLISDADVWLGSEPASTLALMDLDNDGILDIAAGNMDSDAVFMWFGGWSE